jgi:ankyrin repeat protein
MESKMDLRKARDSKGNTALHSAASSGCLASCRFLVEECGIDVNVVSKTGARAHAPSYSSVCVRGRQKMPGVSLITEMFYSSL